MTLHCSTWVYTQRGGGGGGGGGGGVVLGDYNTTLVNSRLGWTRLWQLGGREHLTVAHQGTYRGEGGSRRNVDHNKTA